MPEEERCQCSENSKYSGEHCNDSRIDVQASKVELGRAQLDSSKLKAASWCKNDGNWNGTNCVCSLGWSESNCTIPWNPTKKHACFNGGLPTLGKKGALPCTCT